MNEALYLEYAEHIEIFHSLPQERKQAVMDYTLQLAELPPDAEPTPPDMWQGPAPTEAT